MSIVALTHLPSPGIGAGLRTYVPGEQIDYERALAQHAEYRRLLVASGAEVIALDGNRDLPDSVFVEDAASVAVEPARGRPRYREAPAGRIG
jgi:hypothetical protein